MITRIGMAARRPGLGIDEFQRHWHEVHGPLVCRLEGLRRCWQNHALLREGESLLPWPGFDACSEMDFDDAYALHTAFSPERHPAELHTDSEYLMDKVKLAPMIARRAHLAGTIALTRVRLMTFMRLAPGCSPAELEGALRTSAMAADARARELYVAAPDAAMRPPPCAYDAIDIQWFDRPQQAERYLVSAEAREFRHAISHTVRGVERLVAQVRVIR